MRLFSLSLIVITACGEQLPEDPSLDAELAELAEGTSAPGSKIINGTTVASAGPTAAVLISFDGSLCSGGLLRNDVVLTAAHCDIAQGATITLGERTAVVATSIPNPNWDAEAGTSREDNLNDARLLFLSSPIYPTHSDGKTWELFDRPLRSSSSVDVGEVVIYGYGQNTQEGGAGVLRSGQFMPDAWGDDWLEFLENDQDQLPWSGDSGAVYLVAETRTVNLDDAIASDDLYVAAVHSFREDGTRAMGVPVWLIHDWVVDELSARPPAFFAPSQIMAALSSL